MTNWTLDHVVIAGQDLEQEMKEFEKNLQTKPIPGGTHPSLGTKNALVGVQGSKTYIELLCPDRSNGEGKPGHDMLKIHGASLSLLPYHYAIAASDLSQVKSRAEALGMKASEIQEISRLTPSGKTLKWKVLFLRGHKLGGLVPFFVDWSGSAHPTESMDLSKTTGAACLSVKVIVAGPYELLGKIKSLLSGVEGVEFEEGDTPALYFPTGISGMEGGLITMRGFQPEGIDFEESKSRIFHWTHGTD